MIRLFPILFLCGCVGTSSLEIGHTYSHSSHPVWSTNWEYKSVELGIDVLDDYEAIRATYWTKYFGVGYAHLTEGRNRVCADTFSLGARYPVRDTIDIQLRHYSSANLCTPNYGVNFISVEWSPKW